MIESERLILRSWRDADRAPFHAMSQDPRVMATIGPMLSRARSDALVDRLNGIEAAEGSTFWALERREDGAFLGFCGIKAGPQGTPIAGRPEIGWRLAHAHWGRGYASEAARACLAWAWERDLPLVTAITSVDNVRSRAVMQRIGMMHAEGEDFDHPAVPAESPLLRHVTYRIARP